MNTDEGKWLPRHLSLLSFYLQIYLGFLFYFERMLWVSYDFVGREDKTA